MMWQRRTRGRWQADGFEIRACVVRGCTHYRAIQQGKRRTFFGLADTWHDTAEQAREWCENMRQRNGMGG